MDRDTRLSDRARRALLRDLAARFGTPLHVLDAADLRAAADELVAAFCRASPPPVVCFSYKTNPIPAALRVLHERGIGAEVVSELELWLARRVGVPAERLVVNGAGKTDALLAASVEADPLLVNVDSRSEVARLAAAAERAGRVARVGLRIAPEGARDWFGLDAADGLAAAAEVGRSRWLTLAGLHGHVGTNQQRARPFLAMVDRLAELAARIRAAQDVEIDLLDLGGGFGRPGSRALGLRDRAWRAVAGGDRTAPAPPSQTLGEVARRIGDRVERAFGERRLRRPRLVLEPGRALSSRAQVLLLGVRDLKTDARGRRYAITDGGGLGLVPIVRYEHRRLVSLAEREAPTRRVTVTGPLCTAADVLARDVRLPEPEVGDVIAVLDAGAYVIPLETTFSFPRPAVVQIDGDAEPELVRRRETFQDLLVRDDP